MTTKKTPLLPTVTAFSLKGFGARFTTPTVSLATQPGMNLVIGCNGQGKSTIIQAVVYGLAGGNDTFEDDKKRRWNHRYFHGRIAKADLRSAAVEVSYSFGKSAYCVRRGFASSAVTGFRKGKETWVEDPKQAGLLYAESLELAGYLTTIDFSFVVHRLLYLPESRQLLAWDYDAQVRVLMSLSPDLIDQGAFAKERAALKRLDSTKRHAHVTIGAIRKRIIALDDTSDSDATDDEEDDDDDAVAMTPAPHEVAGEVDLGKLEIELDSVSAERERRQRDTAKQQALLSDASQTVESLRLEVEEREASFVFSELRKTEVAIDLPIQKLLQFAICPCCGTKQKALQDAAKTRAANDECMLCGSAEPSLIDPQLTSLRTQLSEKTRAQRAIASKLEALRHNVDGLLAREMALQDQLNAPRAATHVVIAKLMAEEFDEEFDRGFLEEAVQRLEAEEKQYEKELATRRKRLEDSYQGYVAGASERRASLKASYERYATAFLGKPCMLADSKPKDRLLDLSTFVPEFDGSVRSIPSECSEAQQFFLDIALRMAMIETTAKLAACTGTFFCETPETALDMAHSRNVSEMFLTFISLRHTAILTANLQKESLAVAVMESYSADDRAKRVLSLLELGQPDAVIEANMVPLKAAQKKIRGS